MILNRNRYYSPAAVIKIPNYLLLHELLPLFFAFSVVLLFSTSVDKLIYHNFQEQASSINENMYYLFVDLHLFTLRYSPIHCFY